MTGDCLPTVAQYSLRRSIKRCMPANIMRPVRMSIYTRSRQRPAGNRDIVPHLPQHSVGYRLAANEALHDVLIPTASKFHHDVVHRGSKAWIANQRESR